MVVKVAIDLALDRLFTYQVPVELTKKLAVGQLLLVPFGHRHARGFALEIKESPEENAGYKLKPVEGIADEVPFFSPGTLKLVKTIAAYTASPIETVLKTALPASVLKPGAKAKEQLFVDPVQGASTGNLTKRQKWLYDQIVRLDGGWMSFVCRELSTTPASLKTLAAKNIVEISFRAKRRNPLSTRKILPTKPLKLNDEQSLALDGIKNLAAGETLLLHGITGSGKTEVYLQAIAAELDAGRGAIVMVPEIALTPQTVQRFASRFGDRIAVLHSALSDGERYDEWHRIRSGAARVVVGPRSAVFAPVKDLGLVIVDEEHETSYKQDETPRYHARDVAVMRARIEGAKAVLGSATPSLESWMNVRRGKYRIATMARRAGAGTLPQVLVVDMGEGGDSQGRIFSRQLMDAVGVRLDRREQVILFLNRRGYSRSVVCSVCGHVATCPDCDLAYTYHKADDCCRCHICGGWVPVPKKCPECGGVFEYKGIGTQRAEAALKACFKEARVLRMDADSTRGRHSHDDILGAFRRHEADILIGTQMIAKGLDFPNVTLVGVLNADTSLNMPDFRAAERTYQLLAQVAGRAGRAELPGEALIQTYNPSHSAIRFAAKGDFTAFAEEELREREEAFFPPYCHLCVINLRSQSPETVANWADMYAKSLMKINGLKAGEAVPSVIEKADGWHRWQIVLRSEKVSTAVNAWKWLYGARPPPNTLKVTFDVDAFNFM